jgi:uncharacterized membrane protein YgdD (TMEM256/DUF423 family)
MKNLAAVLISVLLLSCAPAFAQDPGTPAASGGTTADSDPTAASERPVTAVQPVQSVRSVRPAQPVHKFLDLKNSLAMATFGAALAGDSYSTQAGLAYPQLRELNPLARPFVSSRAGQIAYSGASFALFGGGLYLAHRTGHHKLERVAPWIVAGWEGFLAGWNMHQVALARSGH